MSVTKKQVAARVAADTGVSTYKALKVIQGFMDRVIYELSRGNRLEFRDFGVFETTQRKGRMGHNPRTLEKVEVPPRRVVKFKPGRRMSATVL